MMRFFVKEKKDNYFILSSETLKHLKVARIENKNFIAVYENHFYVCELENSQAKIIEKLELNNEFEQEVIIAACFIDLNRFEWLIQKATELGATKLIPVISEHTNIKKTEIIDKKIDRWNKIVLSASQQSFRNKLMTIEKSQKFSEVIEYNITHKFLAHEKTNNKALKSIPVDCLILVGPEGGFSEKEVDMAKNKNFEIISLGKRILRAETASIYLLSQIKE